MCRRRRTGLFLKNLDNRQVALFSGNIRSRKKYQTPRKPGWGEGWKQGNLKQRHKQQARNPILPDLPARTDPQNWGSQTGTPPTALLQIHKPAKRKDPEILTCEDFTQNSHTSRNFTVKPSRWPVLQHAGMPKQVFPASIVGVKWESRTTSHLRKMCTWKKETKTNTQKNENISHPWNKKKQNATKEYPENKKRALVK